MYHISVLTKEMVEHLGCCAGGTYADATLGGGGWAEAMLDASGPDGRVIGFDRDEDSIIEANRRLKKYSARFKAVRAKFSEIKERLLEMGAGSVDGIAADLGCSSHQLDDEARGFSFSSGARLDMRMDRQDWFSAHELVNSAREAELAKIFFEFGEERYSRRIAERIASERRKRVIATSSELAEVVSLAVPAAYRHGRIHPATRVFQALRIAVNDELGELKSLVADAPLLLGRGGRMVVVSYHSLEDRIVKRRFLELARAGGFRLLCRKPILPDDKEVAANRRARSAKLRALERIE